MAKHNHFLPIETVEMPQFNDRQIYGTSTALQPDLKSLSQEYPLRQNTRKITRRKVKTTNVVGVMFLSAVAALLYVDNVIAVNNLAKEVNDLSAKYRQIISMNELLKAEINHKSSLDRISLLAQEQLGMTNPKEAPTWFEVDREKEADLLEK